MPYYEVVFETGNVTVLEAADDETAFAAAGEQDRRARSGEPAGPQGGPAERVAKLYKYPKPPNDYNVEQTASADVLKSEVEALIDGIADANGVVSIPQLAALVQNISHPMVTKENPHDSQFKMEHEAELTLPEPGSSKGAK